MSCLQMWPLQMIKVVDCPVSLQIENVNTHFLLQVVANTCKTREGKYGRHRWDAGESCGFFIVTISSSLVG